LKSFGNNSKITLDEFNLSVRSGWIILILLIRLVVGPSLFDSLSSFEFVKSWSYSTLEASYETSGAKKLIYDELTLSWKETA
jgi:hypothetical protein